MYGRGGNNLDIRPKQLAHLITCCILMKYEAMQSFRVNGFDFFMPAQLRRSDIDNSGLPNFRSDL